MRSEDALQTAVAAYLGTVLPPDAFFTFVDKAGKRTMAQAAQMKSRGIKSGVADGMIWWRGAGFWIELKTPTGRLTDTQEGIFPQAARAGIRIAVCRSVADVHQMLGEWGVGPLAHTSLTPAARDLAWQARVAASPKRAAESRADKPTRKALRVAAAFWRGGRP